MSQAHPQSNYESFKSFLNKNLNFYRIHVLVFTFTPLVAACVFYGSNGKFHISFVDSLFVCVSSMTVTGLTTIDLSSLTPWQQVILFFLMCIGNPIIVSWIIVYTRRYFIKRKLYHIVCSQISALPEDAPVSLSKRPRLRMNFVSCSDSMGLGPLTKQAKRSETKLRPEMIRRIERAPQRIDPSGWLGHGQNGEERAVVPSWDQMRSSQIQIVAESMERNKEVGLDRQQEETERGRNRHFPHAHTIEFVQSDVEPAWESGDSPDSGHRIQRVRSNASRDVGQTSFGRQWRESIHHAPTVSEPSHWADDDQRRFRRTATVQTGTSIHQAKLTTKETGFGGFPYPHVIIGRLFLRLFPRLERHFTTTLTVPHTVTICSQRVGPATIPGTRSVPYISFDAVVGKNSTFRGLTRENMEELGGIEYRGLTLLLWLIGMYLLIVPIFAFIIIAPCMSQSRWGAAFEPPQQHRYIAPPWYSLFQVISAFTNTGTSLVDQSMVPFQKAYSQIVLLPLLILIGNTAYPIFLRFIIWSLTKIINKSSRVCVTLHFLLDHPRRCFIYLFPAHQTWFLLLVLCILTFTDWFFFLVLDIGNPDITSIPPHIRVGLGFLQATAVRAAGFATVPLSALAPAVKVLYVVMMYISVYPIAMSVRSTNVYEERSLGVFFHPDDPHLEEEDLGNTSESRARIWGKYLAVHAQKQLSFDMWWMATALFLLCIVEKTSLSDEANASWFNIFTIIFELTSAYGTVGLSLGLPNANYSFSGALRPLSKLIICAVMLRGRHRGLPVAIDRAVILPPEFLEQDKTQEDKTNESNANSGFPVNPDSTDRYGSPHRLDNPPHT